MFEYFINVKQIKTLDDRDSNGSTLILVKLMNMFPCKKSVRNQYENHSLLSDSLRRSLNITINSTFIN